MAATTAMKSKSSSSSIRVVDFGAARGVVEFDPIAALARHKAPPPSVAVAAGGLPTTTTAAATSDAVEVVPRLGDMKLVNSNAGALITALEADRSHHGGRMQMKRIRSQCHEPLSFVESLADCFFVPSSAEIRRISVVECTSAAHVGQNTVNSALMGTTTPGARCQTCGNYDFQCEGHFGRIELPRPIPHPMFIKTILDTLNSVCSGCGRLLLPEARRTEVLGISNHLRMTYIANIVQSQPSMVSCPRNIELAAKSETLAALGKTAEAAREEFEFCPNDVSKYSTSSQKTAQDWRFFVQSALRSNAVPMKRVSIERIRNIFAAIPSEDLMILGYGGGTRPENLLLEVLPVVPPRCIAPIERDGVLKYDHITNIYRSIIRTIQTINAAQDRRGTFGPPAPGARGGGGAGDRGEFEIDELMDKLNSQVKRMVNSNDRAKANSRDEPNHTFRARLVGKGGAFRKLALGKRINYAARSVIGAGTVPFGAYSIPIVMSIITVPEHVTIYNIDRLRRDADAGRVVTIQKRDGPHAGVRMRYQLVVAKALEDRTPPPELAVGDFVRRLSTLGDTCLLNRQPTLHHYSMASGVIVPAARSTIQIPIVVTPQFGADFDGDEMNALVIQTPRAIAEAIFLMGPTAHITSTASTLSVPGLVFNCPTAAMLLSRDADKAPNVPIISPTEEMQLARVFLADDSRVRTLHARLAKNGIAPRTPRAIFSMTLPSDFYYRREYKDGEQKREVLIRDGVFVHGTLAGADVKGGLIQTINVWYGSDVAARFVTEAFYILEWYIEDRGFSVGLDDCLIMNDTASKDKLKAYVDEVQTNLADLARAAEPKTAAEADRLEELIISELESARTQSSTIAGKTIKPDNPLAVMIGSGAKGNSLNLSEITTMLGPQLIANRRPKLEVGGRTLSYYERALSTNANIAARGFVDSNFTRGMSPADYMVHSSASRVGLIDIQMKTAEHGTSARNLRMVFENEFAGYSGAIENSSGRISLHAYGDGFLPSELVKASSQCWGGLFMPVDVMSLAEALNNSDSFGASHDYSGHSWIPISS